MDELVHHCIRELAFEGDLGCDVSRLRDFIQGFYAHGGATQNVDDAYCAFVWSVVVQQPEVRVGLAPAGVPEVYIAPQQSKVGPANKSHNKKKGDASVVDDPSTAVSLDIVADATLRSLEELKAEYGDALRIAVDPQRSFVAITGSHIRPSKLTPMVYTALQFISRGRESGISVVDLSKKTGYDPKTCHYLVDKLLELNLIEKRKKSGVGANLCIHKYFFDRSEIWKVVQAEEQEATQGLAVKTEDIVPEGEEEEPQTPAPHLGTIQFDPIDSRHLSSLPLLRARLEKLLKNSPHQMHAAQNLLVTIGFSNPGKSDRRFFQTRLRELMAQGVIEKVQVPRQKGKFVTCIRLISPSDVEPPVEIPEGDESEEDTTMKANVTFHRQVVDLIERSGTQGITLNELSKALCHFDKRIVEHQLNRLQQAPPPPHLVDLGIMQLGESHGRERRYKYFTLAHYKIVAEREKLSNQVPDDFSKVGEFMEVDEKLFYKDEAEFNRYVDNFPTDEGDLTTSTGKRKKIRKNPILPDGSVKRGRPRKDATQPRGKKRKRDDEADGADALDITADSASAAGAPPPKKKRGRPRKDQPAPEEAGPSPIDEVVFTVEPSASASTEKVPKKRGRPRKIRIEEEVPATPTPTPRKRGRPRKIPLETTVDTTLPSGQEGQAVPAPSQTEEVLGTQPAELDREREAHADAISVPSAPTAVAEDVPLAQAEVPTIQEPEPTSPFPETPYRRSTRVRKPKINQDETPSPVKTTARTRRRAAERTRSGPPPQEAALDAMNVDATPQRQPPTDHSVQTNPTEQPNGPAEEDVTMAGPSTRVEGTVAIASYPTVNNADATSERFVVSQAPEFQNASTILQTDAPQGSQQKRAEPDTPVLQPFPKRTKVVGTPTGYRAKVNITQSRREKEVLRVIAEAGGVVNIGTKEFFDAHAALIDNLISMGEAASTRQGSRIDKRTLESTLRDLESQGKVKLVSTSVQSATGVSRLVKVAYLAETPPDVLTSFLIDLNRTQVPLPQSTMKTLDEPLEYGGSRSQKIARPAASVILLNPESNPQNDSEKVINFLQADEKIIQASLLTEPNTVMQLYGFIFGKIARVKALHLHSAGLFDGQTTANVVSTEQRIINFSYYMQDLPVSIHCAVVSCRAQNDDLVRLLSTPEGRQTPVGQLPSGIADDLEISKARSRTRLIDSLGILYSLGLIVPLQPSQSNEPFLTCVPNGEHPSTFDMTVFDISVTASVPQYWHFKTNAPIHLWALSDQEPPFWKFADTQSLVAASEYWEDLQRASLDAEFAKQALSTAASAAPPEAAWLHLPAGLIKLLRRPTQWKASYNFSWFQKQYLRQQEDIPKAITPVQIQDGGARLATIATVVNAPKDEVIRFYDAERSKLLREAEKSQTKNRRDNVEQRAKRKAEEKATLAQKAAAAKAQRENDWEEMLHRVHPEPVKGSLVTRIRQVKSRYMQAVKADIQKWESEITAVIEESKKIPVKRTTGTSKPPAYTHIPIQPAPAPVPPSLIIPPHEKPVEDLISLQGPPLSNRAIRKGKEIGEGEDTGRTRRRHRFQWNKEFDELARDASAIIKARCRDGKRLDWAALELVFPAVPRNTVRQRISALREQPGAEPYFKRLEDRWYELWQRHRGTPELPDEDPSSLSNFDIVAHIKFLRSHIDKNALRVGFLETEVPVTAALPTTPAALTEKWDVIEKAPVAPTWDFMWNGTAEEGREKQLIHQAFTIRGNEIPATRAYPVESVYVADSALKMTLTTPNESYNPDNGSRLLVSAGESFVKVAMSDLLDRGVVSKVVRDPKKSKPGRLLKISEVNQNALGGSIPGDLFQDAAALEELLYQDDSLTMREWPLTATDGDTAALIELVSENKIEFKIDTRRSRTARAALDWNSKKTDDDDIETAIFVCPKNDSLRAAQSATPQDTQFNAEAELDTDDAGHIVDVFDQKTCCRRTTTGPVDCTSCLNLQSTKLQAELDEHHSAVLRHVINALEEAGPVGLTKVQLAGPALFDQEVLATTITAMVNADVPLAFWTGYSEVVLVSSRHLSTWSVLISEADTGCVRVFPRRWLDIGGRMMSEVWEAARRAVMGIILFRPGITQAELRWRLRSVYDRREIDDILGFLLSEGHLRRHVEGHCLFDGPPDNAEESSIFWMTGEKKCWYSL